MMVEQYFRPRNWGLRQRRWKRGNPWIKNYTALLSNPDYRALSPNARATLHGLWLICGQYGKVMPLSSSYIGQMLNIRSQTVGHNMKSLLSNNFIELCNRGDSLENISEIPYIDKNRIEKKKERLPNGSLKKGARLAAPRVPKTPSVLKPLDQRKADGKKRGTRLAADWAPGPDDYNFADNIILDPLDIEEQAARFRDYWHAKPGQAGVKLDWSATWRNWIRRAGDFASQTTRSPPSDNGNVASMHRVNELLRKSANGELRDDNQVIDEAPIGDTATLTERH